MDNISTDNLSNIESSSNNNTEDNITEQFNELSDIDTEDLSLISGEEEASLNKVLSAYLFVSSKPLSIDKLCSLLDRTEDEIRNEIEILKENIFSLDLGFELIEINNSFQFRTSVSVKKFLERLITPKMKRLSKAAAETLAVIAYKQPVSKAEIEVIRGVDPVPTLRTLVDGSLIRIVGREDTPGNPALYGTTDFFLERFGLKNLSELPSITEMDIFLGGNPQEDNLIGKDTVDDDTVDNDISENDADDLSENNDNTNRESLDFLNIDIQSDILADNHADNHEIEIETFKDS